MLPRARPDSRPAVSRRLIASVLLAAGCADAAPAITACTPDDATVITAALPGSPREATFSELWRVGAEDDDAHFGLPLPLAVSRDGRAATADFMLTEVFVVEPDGAWKGRLARQGRGPGELASPVAVAWDDEGGLHVFDIMRPAVVGFTPDLEHAGDARIEPEAVRPILDAGELTWAAIEPSGALLLIPAIDPPAGDGFTSEALLRYRSGSTTADTILAARFPAYSPRVGSGLFGAPGWPRVTAATAGHRIAAGTGDGYLVHVFDDGVPAFTICAETVPAAPLRPDERGVTDDTAHAAIASAIAALRPVDAPAAFGRIVVGADGSIWVQRDRRDAFPGHLDYLYGVPGAVYDVFESDGRYRHTLRLPPRARLQGARGDTIWAYEHGGFDDIALVAYRIQPH